MLEVRQGHPQFSLLRPRRLDPQRACVGVPTRLRPHRPMRVLCRHTACVVSIWQETAPIPEGWRSMTPAAATVVCSRCGVAVEPATDKLGSILQSLSVDMCNRCRSSLHRWFREDRSAATVREAALVINKTSDPRHECSRCGLTVPSEMSLTSIFSSPPRVQNPFRLVHVDLCASCVYGLSDWLVNGCGRRRSGQKRRPARKATR